MKKILIRSGMRPTDVYTAEDMYLRDRTGFNNGNLAYQYSIYRTLWQEETELVPDGLSTDPSRAARYNEEYDVYIIPLADAFREDFRPQLRNYTALIKQLKIPVIITGVGLRAAYEPQLEQGFSFDEDVKGFVKAVLEKSAKLGLRGQITADYLKQLGFKEQEDYEVIGCPSLYTFGSELKIRDLNLQRDSLIAINASPVSSEASLQFLNEVIQKHPNYYFIPQHLDEFHLMYAGGPDISSDRQSYPVSILDCYYKEGRVKYFTSMPSWYDFMRQASFSIGPRLHGNVIPTIVGTPNVSFVQDARMRELASYHNLPHVTAEKLSEIQNLEVLLGQVDLKSAEKVQKQNFDRFIDFLDANQVPHIYTESRDRKEAPLDVEIAALTFPESAKPITVLTGVPLYERIQTASRLLKERHQVKVDYENHRRDYQIKQLTAQLNQTKNQLTNEQKAKQGLETKLNESEQKLTQANTRLEKQQAEIKHYKGTLNRKAVRATLKVADSLAKLKGRTP
ncbi:polysaccharide pyruvyl transferase family protein [Listeria aquatica]|uniref:polysaccharide pyruvyl transferase family protein n=1 Tax=Listeria aquatica TaxID=1494960 RepID=UPI003F720993